MYIIQKLFSRKDPPDIKINFFKKKLELRGVASTMESHFSTFNKPFSDKSTAVCTAECNTAESKLRGACNTAESKLRGACDTAELKLRGSCDSKE